jgi:hypothetical protein
MHVVGPGVWGEPADPGNSLAVLRRAVELGVTLIDTAEVYGPHVSEDLISEALHLYPSDLLIATKGGIDRPTERELTPNGRPEFLRTGVEGSPLSQPRRRTNRPVAAAPDRPDGPSRRVSRCVGRAPRRRKDRRDRPVGGLAGRTAACYRGHHNRHGPEQVQRRRPSARGTGDLL